MLSRASRPGGACSKSCAGLLFWGRGNGLLRKGLSPLEQQQPWDEVRVGSWVGVTHGEAQLAKLAGTERTATVSIQPSTKGLPFRLKGSLAQGLQLFPLLLGSLGGLSRPQIQGQVPAVPSLVYSEGTHLAVGVQWCPHAWLQQSQCKGLQYIQVVSHLVAQWRCTMNDVLEDSQSMAVSMGSQGEEEWGWGSAWFGLSYLIDELAKVSLPQVVKHVLRWVGRGLR